MARRIKKFNSEENLHQQVVDYLQLQYPGIMFRTDFAAGIKMTPGQAVKHAKLQSGRAWPDLFIAAPMYKDEVADFYGLFIELKKEGTKLVREKDAKQVLKGDHGEIRKKGDWWDRHIEEQAEVIQYLKLNGYCATFAVGFEAAKEVIDKYLDGYRMQLEHVREQMEKANNEEVF